MPTTRTLRVFIDTPYDESPDASWLYQTPAELGSLEAAVASRRRVLALEQGDWYFIGVRLVAEVTLTSNDDVPNPTWRENTIRLYSPGVWGVESDSCSEYVRELAMEDAEYLREDLEALGVLPGEFQAALAEADHG
jgi:hypothetical protein